MLHVCFFQPRLAEVRGWRLTYGYFSRVCIGVAPSAVVGRVNAGAYAGFRVINLGSLFQLAIGRHVSNREDDEEQHGIRNAISCQPVVASS
jgi:hypothetical protein